MSKKPKKELWTYNGEAIKQIAKAYKGMANLADKLNVSRGTLSNWANGRCKPSLDSILHIANETGVSPSSFFKIANGSKKQQTVFTAGKSTYLLKLGNNKIEIEIIKDGK